MEACIQEQFEVYLVVLIAGIAEARSFTFFSALLTEALVFFLFFCDLLEGVLGAFPFGSTMAKGE